MSQINPESYDSWKLSAPAIKDNPYQDSIGKTIEFNYVYPTHTVYVLGILEDVDSHSITVSYLGNPRVYEVERIRPV